MKIHFSVAGNKRSERHLVLHWAKCPYVYRYSLRELKPSNLQRAEVLTACSRCSPPLDPVRRIREELARAS